MSRPTPALELHRIGEELFQFWSATDQTAAALGGGRTERIGTPLLEQSEAVASRARAWLCQLDALRTQALEHEQELTRRFIRFEASKLEEAAVLHLFDLQITPYRIGMILADVHQTLRSLRFDHPGDVEAYESVLNQYDAFLRSTLLNLKDQVARGIVAPVKAIQGCVGVVEGLAATVAEYVRVAPERLARLPLTARATVRAVDEHASKVIQAAYAELSAYLKTDYAPRAEEPVGLSHFPGGSSAYERLIRQHVTLPMTPEAVHQRGITLVAEIEEAMARTRAELGFKGTGAAFLLSIKQDSRFYRDTSEQVGELYLELVQRCEAVLPRAFGSRSFPPYAVKRLQPEAEGGMTFGYYQPPVPGQEANGYYLYNGSNLKERPLVGAASLIYHELIPGHHLHVATEMTDSSRPLVRRLPTITAFSEGWAEYAADLGFELGLYEDPYDRYGRYINQVFLASRLVVDTGLNSLGWTYERARLYLLDHTALSPTEIDTELVRYATALPGQALTYALGRQQFWQIRRTAESQLGNRFDLTRFHDVVLEGGSLPLPDLAFSVQHWAQSTSV
jgi:uncharacterized protein (DUF885 family)